jgi:hypothetical protein
MKRQRRPGEMTLAIKEGELGSESVNEDVLGKALNIHQVAELIGVCVWQVRQRFLPAGLPFFRAAPRGKLLFHKNLVIEWVRTQIRTQQQGRPR